jgi:hypothetical protein
MAARISQPPTPPGPAEATGSLRRDRGHLRRAERRGARPDDIHTAARPGNPFPGAAVGRRKKTVGNFLFYGYPPELIARCGGGTDAPRAPPAGGQVGPASEAVKRAGGELAAPAGHVAPPSSGPVLTEQVARSPFIWVIEWTKAGKPHYHVLIWLPQLAKLPKPDQAGWWSKGMTRTERIRAAGVGYIAKYASKPFFDESEDGIPFPRGRVCLVVAGLMQRQQRSTDGGLRHGGCENSSHFKSSVA